jgi:2'-5' RNA ligase
VARPVFALAIIVGMTRRAEARLFVALDLPVEVRAPLVAWARAAAASVRAGARAAARAPSAIVAPGHFPTRRRESRPLPSRHLRLLGDDTLHVTLCFLGDRPVGEIEALGEALALACAEAPPVGELSFGAPLWLPPRHPRALAVELHDTPDGSLEALHGAVCAALVGVGERGTAPARGARGAEGRRGRFRPHVTVARMRPSEAPRERLLPPTPALSFLPRSVTLQRSWLTPTEAVYEGLATCALAAPSD